MSPAMRDRLHTVAIYFFACCLILLTIYVGFQLVKNIQAQQRADTIAFHCEMKLDNGVYKGKIAIVEDSINCLTNLGASDSEKRFLRFELGFDCRNYALADVGAVMSIDEGGPHPLTVEEVKTVHALAREMKKLDVQCPDVLRDPANGSANVTSLQVSLFVGLFLVVILLVYFYALWRKISRRM